MIFYVLALSFPEWRLHFAFLDTARANEMIFLRWLHLVFGIIWIGLLYFFNLVLTPAMKKCDPKLRIKIYPELMPGAMGWFRSSALVWLAAYALIYALQLPAKGLLDSAWVRVIGISVVVIAASWLVLALNGGPNVSNAHLAISIG